MQKCNIDYQLLVFLYAYLRQIDLSLDRSRWMPLEGLRKYYKTQISPKAVAYYIIKKYNLDIERIQYFTNIKRLSLWGRVKSTINGLIFCRFSLFRNDLYYCCHHLLLFNEYLISDFEYHKLEIEKLRIDFCHLTYGIIEYKLFPKERNRTMRIEHYLESDTGTPNPKMEEFTKGFNTLELLSLTAPRSC